MGHTLALARLVDYYRLCHGGHGNNMHGLVDVEIGNCTGKWTLVLNWADKSDCYLREDWKSNKVLVNWDTW